MGLEMSYMLLISCHGPVLMGTEMRFWSTLTFGFVLGWGKALAVGNYNLESILEYSSRNIL